MSGSSPPRSLARRPLLPIEVTPYELHRLILVLECDAKIAANSDDVGYADFLFQRVAALREASR